MRIDADVVVLALPDPMRAEELPAQRTGVRVVERARIGLGSAGVPGLHQLLGGAQTRGVRRRWGCFRGRLGRRGCVGGAAGGGQCDGVTVLSSVGQCCPTNGGSGWV